MTNELIGLLSSLPPVEPSQTVRQYCSDLIEHREWLQAEEDKPSQYPEVDVHIRYVLNGESIEETQTLSVEVLAPDRLLIKTSSFFHEDFKFYFGDEIVVRQIDDQNFQFVSCVEPRAMRHFASSGRGKGEFPTNELHAFGGEWECDMGLFFVAHIPAVHLDSFVQRFDLAFSAADELFSGV
jgi:hypothetical protein